MKDMIEPGLLSVLEPSLQMGKWKEYEEYKDSGVEWLGKIPVHWESTVMKRYLKSLKDGTHGTFQRVQEGIPLLSAKNVDNGKVEVSDHESLISEVDYHSINSNGYLKIGDLLLTIVGTIGRAAIFEYPSSVAFQRSVAVLRFQNKHLARYFFFLMQSGYVQAELSSRAKQSAQSGIYLSDVALIPGLAPPLSEQYAITAFLDYKTTKLNELIAHKEHMISLLQERRTAIINQAVTRGLNQDVPLKDSGVDWLGEIPAHWEVRKIKYVAEFFGGGTPSKANIGYWAGNIPWVSPKDMKSEIILDTEDHISIEALGNSTTNLIQAGAVLIVVRSGILKHTIPIAINNVPVTINQDIKAILPNNLLLSQYLASLIHSHQEIFLMEWRKSGATVESIEYDLLINTPVPIPPIKEQKEIVTSIQQKTVPIDKLITVIQEGIKKLKEYSTALISAAVTGKIDVRGEVADVQAEETAM